MEAATTDSLAQSASAQGAKTIAEAFRITAARRPGEVAIRTKGDEFTITWGELRSRVDALAGGLAKLGLERGQTLALMMGNRPEFHICDLAGMMLGAAPFSIYNTYTAEQIAYLVGDADARILICSQEYLPQVLAARESLPHLEHVILVDGEPPEGVLALSEVEGSNPDFDLEASIAQIKPSDVLTLIYTSGTTGPPKGVQLIHRNLIAAVEGLDQLIEFPADGRVISWLPSAHIAERAAHHYLPLVYGLQITCCDDPRQVLSYLPEVRPSWFFAVPRIWEKLKAGLDTMVASQPEEQRKSMEAALDAAVRKVRLEQRGEEVPAELAEQVAKADERDLRRPARDARPGQSRGDQRRARRRHPSRCSSSSTRSGCRSSELWGMSETCGAGAVNPTGKIKIGTVGPPAPGVELKLDTDGEVLMKSEVVMLGYRNLPEKTAEAFTEDGWLRTGDIGDHRRGRLSDDRRPQEGAHHQRRRQEHVAGEHRGDHQELLPADRPGLLHRRRAALQHGADRARLRLRARLGGIPRHRGHLAGGARRERADPCRGPGGRGRRQREAGARRTDQEVHDRRGRLAARGR